jgi:hypothetical protein
MTVVTVKPGQLGATLTRSIKIQQEGIKRGIQRAKVRAIGVLKANTPKNDTGLLKNAWIVTGSGVTNTAPHAGIIERGARPHSVNREGIEALTEWVRRKGLVVHMVSSGPIPKVRKLTRKEASADKDVSAIVWAIVTHLKKQGQEGTFYIQKSLPRLNKILEEEVIEALTKSMESSTGTVTVPE